jgi:hypothetical protein
MFSSPEIPLFSPDKKSMPQSKMIESPTFLAVHFYYLMIWDVGQCFSADALSCATPRWTISAVPATQSASASVGAGSFIGQTVTVQALHFFLPLAIKRI